MERRIYLDNSATTPVKDEVLTEMLPYFKTVFGNPSSQHFYGREAVKVVDESRDKIAKLLGAKPSEIYFTSGGTESDNWAIKGIAEAYKNKGKHVIVSSIEHHAVLEPCRQLEQEGYEVTYLPVNDKGIVEVDTLVKALREDTILVGIMYANNEVGTIQPIEEIAGILKERKIPFLVDAVQAVNCIDFDLSKLPITLLSISAHKFNGPKGIGCLFIRTGTRLSKLVAGGHQERAQRGGTTDTPLIVGFAKALEIAKRDMASHNEKKKALRDYFVKRVEEEIPFVTFNGDREKRVSGNANFSFAFIEGESILFRLDLAGIAVSSGSACSSGSLEPSHVLLAMGIKEEVAHGSIRFTFSEENTFEEVDYVVDELKKTVKSLREMSPLFKLEGEEKYV